MTVFRTGLIATALLLATGCYDVESIRAYVTWDVDNDELDVRYEWLGLQADQDSPCFDDAAKCADHLHKAILDGDLLGLDSPDLVVHGEGLRIEGGRLDLLADFSMPVVSSAAQDLGITLESQGRPGRERTYLRVEPDGYLALGVIDAPPSMERRTRQHWVDGKAKSMEAFVFDPRQREVTLGVDGEGDGDAGVLQAMPELEGELRRRGLVSE